MKFHGEIPGIVGNYSVIDFNVSANISVWNEKITLYVGRPSPDDTSWFLSGSYYK